MHYHDNVHVNVALSSTDLSLLLAIPPAQRNRSCSSTAKVVAISQLGAFSVKPHFSTSHTLHYQTLPADPSRIREGAGYETTSIFQAKKRQKADSPVVTAITKFKFSGHVVLIFCILTVAVGQIQTCSPTYLNHIRNTVLIQRTHSQGFAAHTELIRTCSEQSDTHLQQLQYIPIRDSKHTCIASCRNQNCITNECFLLCTSAHDR